MKIPVQIPSRPFESPVLLSSPVRGKVHIGLALLLLLLRPALGYAQTFTVGNNAFPTTAVGQSVTQDVTLTVNTAVPITSIAIPAGFTEYKLGTISGCTVESNGNTIVAAATVCNLPITFTPAVPGKVTAAAPIGRSAPLLVTDVENARPNGYAFPLLGGATAPLISFYPGSLGTVTSPGGAPGCAQKTDTQGDGCPAADASALIYQAAVDAAGNIFLVGGNSYVVRRIDAITGIITLYAGQYGNQAQALGSGDGGPATSALFYIPIAIAVDAADNVYVADYTTIRKINPATGIIQTIVGDGHDAYAPGRLASDVGGLPTIQTVAVDPAGDVFFGAQSGIVYRIDGTTGVLSIYAGNGTMTTPAVGIGGLAANAQIGAVQGLALDSGGRLYIADQVNTAVYRVDPITRIITEFAGTSPANAGPGSGCQTDSGDGGAATSAFIDGPVSLAFDPADNLYIMEAGSSFNSRSGGCPIRRVDASTGLIHTVAATSANPPVTSLFLTDPSATDEYLDNPTSISVGASGSLYIVSNFGLFNKIDSSQAAAVTFPQEITGTISNEDAVVTASNIGIGTALTFSNEPFATSGPPFTTYAVLGDTPVDCSAGPLAPGASCGIGVQFNPSKNGTFNGTETVQDNSLNVSGSSQTISLLAGVRGYTAPVIYATLSASGLTFPSTAAGTTSAAMTIQLQAAGNATVEISSITITGANPTAFAISANDCGTSLAAGTNCNLSVTFTPSTGTTFNAVLSVVDNTNAIASPQTATLTGNGTAPPPPPPVAQLQFTPAILDLVAGSFTAGYTGDNGPATSATLNRPTGIAYDSAGNLYIADTGNYVVRKVDTTGIITTFAGDGTQGYSGDNGPATHAGFSEPNGLAFDAAGNLYVSDGYAGVVRKIDTTGKITTFAGNGTLGYTGDNGPATSAELYGPQGLAFDNAGNLYIADTGNQVVRIVNSAGTIQTFAGNGAGAGSLGTYSGDGGPATSAGLYYPYDVALDNAGNVYISDASNQRIRVVNSAGIINTFAGTGFKGNACSGAAALSTNFAYPSGLLYTAGGDLFLSEQEGGLCEVDAAGNINAVMADNAGDLRKSSIGESDLLASTNGPIFFTMDKFANLVVANDGSNAVTSSGAVGTLTFPAEQLLDTSNPLTITLANPGAATLTFSGSPTVTGPFAIATGGTCNLTVGISPGTDCTLAVTFTPTVDGPVTGSIVLASNAIGSPATVQLSGTGQGQLTLGDSIVPNSMNFSSPVGTTSAPQTATITNTGQGPITITGVTITGSGAATFTQTNDCLVTLAAGQKCTLQVTFLPSAAGIDIASATLTVATSYAPLYLQLNGTGTTPPAPIATLNPTTIPFPNTSVGSTSATLSTVLSNTGNATLTITGITITGANPANFTLTGNTCGSSVPAGSNCSISASFTPSSGTTFNAAIAVADNAANTPQTATLSGTGIAQPLPTLTPASKFFGAASVGQGDGPIYFTLTNTATTSLTGIVLSITGPNAADFQIYGPDNCPSTIGPQSSCSIEMNFYPSAQGSRTATLNVASSATSAPLTAALSGTGTPAPTPQLEITPAQLLSIAGTGKTAPGCAITGTNGPALKATLCTPYDAAVDSLGNTYLVDSNDNVVLKVDPTGILTTFAGGGTVQGDNGPATSAILSSPIGIVVDLNNNVYISEQSTGRIRVVSSATGTITTFVGGATGYFNPGTSGTAVTLLSPGGMAFDTAGNLYIAVDGQQIVAEVSPAGVATLFAGVLTPQGPGRAGYNGDNIPANTAYLNSPQQVAIDKFGQVYIADSLNYRVRMVSGGTITTVAGNGTQGETGDGGPATSAEIGAQGVAASSGDEIFVTDGTTIRQFVAGGNISTIAGGGTGTPGGPIDGPALGATIGAGLLAVDTLGNVLIPEYGPAPQLLSVNSTGLLNFGNQALQTTSNTLTVTLTDIGNDFTGLNFTLPFTATGDFAVTGNDCQGGDGGVSSCTLTVTFTPSELGGRTGSITLTSNAASGTNTILLEGNGTAALSAQAVLTPTTITFPNTTTGATSAALSTVLSNPGNTTLNIAGITLTGANPTDFAISSNTCGTTLAAGANCTISATFTPATATTFAAAISVADNAANTPQSATLSGTGTAAPAPQAVLTPTTITFPNTTVGATSAALSTVLSNPGNATLNIAGITITGANSTDFVISSNTCGTTLAAGAICTISATFTPATATTFAAAISVADNAANTPQSATLTGTGTAAPAPQAVLTPTTITFPNTTVGATSAALSTVLSNPGNAPLNIAGITLTGANPTDFAISSNTCGTTLAAGANCTISATFTPATATTFAAAISVADNAANTPQSATLTGTGTAAPAPQAVLTPTTITFPNTTVGATSAALSTVLSNPGNATLNIAGITLSGTNPTDFAISSNTCGTTLAAGANCTISATFTPAAATTFAAAITVADNAANTPQSATLTGTGTPVSAGDFTLTPTTSTGQVQPGSIGSYTINAAGLGGPYNSAINFSATGLPPGATFTFTPAAVTPGSSGASTVLAIQTQSPFALLSPHRQSQPPWLAAVLLIPLAGLTRLRRVRSSRLFAVLLCGLTLAPILALAGCAGGYYQPVPQSYTITITGTSGTLQHSTTVTLTVE